MWVPAGHTPRPRHPIAQVRPPVRPAPAGRASSAASGGESATAAPVRAAPAADGDGNQRSREGPRAHRTSGEAGSQVAGHQPTADPVAQDHEVVQGAIKRLDRTVGASRATNPSNRLHRTSRCRYAHPATTCPPVPREGQNRQLARRRCTSSGGSASRSTTKSPASGSLTGFPPPQRRVRADRSGPAPAPCQRRGRSARAAYELAAGTG